MATLTVHATIVRANDALADLMSCEPRDLVGVDYGRLTGGLGDVLDHRLEALRTSQENVATFEHRIPGPPGATDVRTALVTLVPIRDSGGQMLYVFAQVQDISAQRTVEDELHRTEEKFRLLVAAVEEYAVFMLDTRGRVMSWNAGARRIKGYQADEIIGNDFRVFYPEEQQLTGHPQRNLEAALRDGSFAEEGWRVRQDGTRFWASVVISPVHDDRGLHIGFAKVTRDQTAQRQNADDRVGGHGRAGAPARRDGPRAAEPDGRHRRQCPRPAIRTRSPARQHNHCLCPRSTPPAPSTSARISPPGTASSAPQCTPRISTPG